MQRQPCEAAVVISGTSRTAVCDANPVVVGGSDPGTPPATATPAVLVAAAQAGDADAFGELYARYAGMVHSIALARVPIDSAADVVQEAFLRALRRLHTLRTAEAFGGWLAAIARNAARDVNRRQRDVGMLDEDPSAPGQQHDELDARAALHAIRSLPAAYRDTLMMRLVHGMSGPEIAEQTGLTRGSVRVNLHRGLKLLRAHLEHPRKGGTP